MVGMGVGRRDGANLEGRSVWQVFSLVVVLMLVVLESPLDVCTAQSMNDAVAYLNNVEDEVMRVAAKATENFVKTCGTINFLTLFYSTQFTIKISPDSGANQNLVDTCGGNCSRQSCEPMEGDLDLLTCKNVARNGACSDANGNLGCSQLRVTLAKSYVRVPSFPNVTLTFAANSTICSQRMLDPVFLNISRFHNSAINLTSWFYLGSVEGVQRSFPGRDVPRGKCTFEPRKRPWYLGATAVQKDLVILLDGGYSMGGALPGDILTSRDAFTKFTASVNIVKELLDTLTYGDRVSGVLFSSSTTANVVMTLTFNGNASYVQTLKTSLDALTVDAEQGASNLMSGMVTANETFASGANANALKVLIVITDGEFADRTALSSLKPILTSLRSQKVLTLLYSFDRTTPAMATLSQIACSVNGTYARIEETVVNPLWTLRSYFGVVAYWRLSAVKFRPYWSKPYNDSGGLSQVITVAFPVFAPDNYTLIGVVGSDVLMTELGNFDTTGFSSALLGRPTDDPLTVPSQPLPCNVKLSSLNTCPSATAPMIPLCRSNDTSNVSFEERVCTCPPQCKAPLIKSEKKRVVSPAVVGAVAGGGAFVLIIFILLVIYCCRRRSQARKIENQASGLASTIQGVSPKRGSMSTSAASSGSKRWLLRCLGYGSSNVPPANTVPDSMFCTPSSRRTKSSKIPAWPVRNQSLSRDVIAFTMKELEDATNNWSRAALLGRGACGGVYKGRLHGVMRAIKRPHPGVTEMANSTFEKELDLLSKLNHRCLVRLIGYCDDNHILVFEYMKHGTLEDCLHKNRLGRVLTWEERLKIAAGAAKGLEYLHEYATTMIIHGDVKPANILLDANLEAHISDFGLSLSTHDQDISMLWASKMGGTPGYFDPEYASLGNLTPKSDVYSFGIVLLEILSGRKVVQSNRNITAWAAELYEQDVTTILDPNLEPPRGVDPFHSIIALALQCVQKEHRYRPKMKDVFARLSRAAMEWEKFEAAHEEGSQIVDREEVRHPSRRQHPQYHTPSQDSMEIYEEDIVQYG